MKYPTLQAIETTRQTVEVFGGYNHNLRIGDGEFYDMKNMTSDFYPVMSPREPRGKWDGHRHGAWAGCTDLIVNQGICGIRESVFLIPGGEAYHLGMDGNTKKSMTNIGANVIIFPDKKWINVLEADRYAVNESAMDLAKVCGDMEVLFTVSGDVSFAPCTADGTVYEEAFVYTKPSDPTDGALWVDCSDDEKVLKKWDEKHSMWVKLDAPVTKITCTGIGSGFSPGDTVEISGIEVLFASQVNGKQQVLAVDTDMIVIKANIWEQYDGASNIGTTICRTVPDMDFICEAGNRVWGCRYSLSEENSLNEIYASKLGDFKNWNCNQGISTDSYVISIGGEGRFTGAVSFQGRPIFFKENCMIEVYGSYPAQFQLQTTPCHGVQPGCEKSLAVVEGILFYKATDGVYAFDGSMPKKISNALGFDSYQNAVAGGAKGKYYISMQNTDTQKWSLFVYDVTKGLWHKEDDLHPQAFCTWKGELYCLPDPGDGFPEGALVNLSNRKDTYEDTVPWMVETGRIGLSLPDSKYLSKLMVRMSLEMGSMVNFSVRYDGSEAWEHLGTYTGTDLRSFTVPIRPKRCDHMQLRIDGVGMAKIYSITRTIEQGSDVS